MAERGKDGFLSRKKRKDKNHVLGKLLRAELICKEWRLWQRTGIKQFGKMIMRSSRSKRKGRGNRIKIINQAMLCAIRHSDPFLFFVPIRSHPFLWSSSVLALFIGKCVLLLYVIKCQKRKQIVGNKKYVLIT